MFERETICAIVVTYNRKQFLLECLEALNKQSRPIDAIYVIDNASTDNTQEILRERGYIDKILIPKDTPLEDEKIFSGIKIHYVRMHENTGGAGGFYEGVKRGFEKGYSWLWLMDDDSEPEKEALELLMNEKKESVCALCPLIVNSSDKMPEFYHHKMLDKYFRESYPTKEIVHKNISIPINGNAFVGPLIRSSVVKIVGYPEKAFYIYADDTEYIYRISKIGKVLLVPASRINHKDKIINGLEDKILSWKVFYSFRNRIIFSIKYHNYVSLFYLFLIYFKWLGSAFVKVIIHKRNFKEAYLILRNTYYCLYEGLSGKPNVYFPIEKKVIVLDD